MYPPKSLVHTGTSMYGPLSSVTHGLQTRRGDSQSRIYNVASRARVPFLQFLALLSGFSTPFVSCIYPSLDVAGRTKQETSVPRNQLAGHHSTTPGSTN